MPSTITNGGSHMYRVFKVRQVLLSGLALLVVAAGMIVLYFYLVLYMLYVAQ